MNLHLLKIVALTILVCSIWAVLDALSDEKAYGGGGIVSRVSHPLSHPTVSQESIDRAVRLFDIKVPEHVKWPQLDRALSDRGVTLQKGVGDQYQVMIGPAAFSSWALLGSTLAHEIEVHCHQNFTVLRLLDLVGISAIFFAERRAYSYELNQADRFNLKDKERQNIRETLALYYSDE